MASYYWIWLIVSALAFSAVGGCAGVRNIYVEDDANTDGIRYYVQAPFIMVHTDNAGGLTSKLIYLPDTTRIYSVKPYSYLAKNDTTLKFDRGVLTEGQTVVDTAEVPKAIIGALETVASATAMAAFDVPDRSKVNEVPMPVLLRVVNDKEGWKLKGTINNEKIFVTVSSVQKDEK